MEPDSIINLATEQMVPAPAIDIKMMRQGLSAYLILFIMGMLCAIINVVLIYVLLRSPKLCAELRLLVSLAFGDMTNCISLSLLGYFRYHLYLNALQTGLVPLETTRTCAMKPHMWLR
ncbi:unnamed protein product [Haemonchus placei]|uniref:G_PROTEIN_RECEP_F1_2 domain-containing protein n=1 Tax=Haemonchus placei TaxID=6290 RepID=A0A0N4XBN8_HAEPC|nr:unnamed protein product [Haemonchus placei]